MTVSETAELSSSAERLAAWMRTADHLAAHYHAPRLLGKLELAGRYGAVFERLAGETPDRGVAPRVLDQIVPVVTALHEDRELASKLGGG